MLLAVLASPAAAADPADCGPFGVPAELVPLGDSITQASASYPSYRRRLWHELDAIGPIFDFVGSIDVNAGGPNPHPDFDLDHDGHAGWTTVSLLNGQDGMGSLSDWLQGYDPDVVLLHIGTNDLRVAGDDATIVAGALDGVEQIIDVLRSDVSDVCILLAQLIPSTVLPMSVRIPQFNAQIPALASLKSTPLSPVVVIDQFTGFDAMADSYDGIHPNIAGEIQMAETWRDAVVSIPIVPQCDDGTDNDGDGFADHPADPGCASPDQLREDPACQDGIDNDGDGLIDHPADPGCASPTRTREETQCQDGLDNDGQIGTDFDGGASVGVNDPNGADPHCSSFADDFEAHVNLGGGCGMGPEIALLLPLLGAWRAQRRRLH